MAATRPERREVDLAEGFERKAERSWPLLDARALFTILYFVAIFVMAISPAVDPDLWWHLRTGELILEQGIPDQDPFSFTVSGKAWITHEWLSQLIMWLLYLVGGFPLLILAFAAVITATFGLIYLNSAGKPVLAVFLGLIAAFASAITWGVRPQMFNPLFLALFMIILEAVRRGRFGMRAILWLPALTIVWANLHSGYLAGIALIVVYAVGDGLQGLLRGRLVATERLLTGRQIGLFLAAAAGCLLAAALNPNSFSLWLYPFETLRSPSMQQFIQEWQPPLLREPMFWPFAILLFLGVVGWVYGKRPGLSDFLLFLGTGAAGMMSARNIPLFAVVAAPIISRAMWPWLEGSALDLGGRAGRKRKRPPRLLQAVNVLLLAICLLAGGLWAFDIIAGQDEVVQERFPVAAVDFLEAQGLSEGRGFNDYGWGGYLIWRGIPVYVDGRADVYGDDFLFFYQQAALVQEGWREPLQQYDVNYALLHKEARLGVMLQEVGGWREVYADELARIFVREE